MLINQLWGTFRSQNLPYLLCLGLFLTVLFGGLTHYYFYFFAAILGLCVCIYLLFFKKIELFFIYSSALSFGVITALIIFPYTLNHIFGYRGSYATRHIGTFTPDKFLSYIGFINQSMFGNYLYIIIGLIILLLFIEKIHHIAKISPDNTSGTTKIHLRYSRCVTIDTIKSLTAQNFLIISIFIATLGFLYIAIQGSEMIASRYIYPCYPILSISFFMFVAYIFRKFHLKTNLTVIMISIALCIASINKYGIDWLYADYKYQIEGRRNLAGTDCIIICKDNSWVNVLEGMDVYILMDEVRCVYESQLSEIQTIVHERKTINNPLSIAFFSDEHYSTEQQKEIVQLIAEHLGLQNTSLTYDYLTKIYTLY